MILLSDGVDIADLQRRFNATCPEFQTKIKRLSEQSPHLTTLGVFSLWRKYSDQCDAGDQSAILFEFVRWYAIDLGIEGRENEVLQFAERA